SLFYNACSWKLRKSIFVRVLEDGGESNGVVEVDVGRVWRRCVFLLCACTGALFVLTLVVYSRICDQCRRTEAGLWGCSCTTKLACLRRMNAFHFCQRMLRMCLCSSA